MGFIMVEPGVELYVEDLNPSGHTTLLFLHGWPLNHKQFEYQFNVLPDLGYRCIGVDWRGFGKSDKPAHGYHLDRLADDIRVIVDTMQLTNFILIGHSTGGAIAIHYMARHQGYGVSKLVLVDAAAPTSFTSEVADQFLHEVYNDRPKLIRDVTDQFFFQYVTEPFAQWFFLLCMEAASWSTAAIIKLLKQLNIGNEFSSITVPTLIIHGVQDKVVPYSQAEEVHQKISNSILEPFYFSGHGGFWEERDKFNQLLVNFTNSNNGNRGVLEEPFSFNYLSIND